MSRKPKDGDEDPAIVAEIEKARENIGLFIRKTHPMFENDNSIDLIEQEKKLFALLNKVSHIIYFMFVLCFSGQINYWFQMLLFSISNTQNT